MVEKTDDKDNSEFREDLPKEKDDEILKAGQEIPNPPDDLEDGTEDSSENIPNTSKSSWRIMMAFTI